MHKMFHLGLLAVICGSTFAEGTCITSLMLLDCRQLNYFYWCFADCISCLKFPWQNSNTGTVIDTDAHQQCNMYNERMENTINFTVWMTDNDSASGSCWLGSSHSHQQLSINVTMSSITVRPHHHHGTCEQNPTFCSVPHHSNELSILPTLSGEICREYEVTNAILILRGANGNPTGCGEFISVSVFFNQLRMGMCFNNSIEIKLTDTHCVRKCKQFQSGLPLLLL